MSESPRQRRYWLREQQIIDHARRIAEAEGWSAVSTRRLAQEIDHSQPVIYQHFRNRELVVAAVAKQGFVELTGRIADVAQGSGPRLEALCWSYVEFGRENPALYAAMFTRATDLEFAAENTPAELRESFKSLVQIIREETRVETHDDAMAVTEMFWASCHGLISLHLSGRIPQAHLPGQVKRLCRMITYVGGQSR